MSSSIKNVIIIGGTGSIGPTVIPLLQSNGFTVSILSRESSIATFPGDITVHRTDYTIPSLLKAFTNQDAIISAIAALSALQQNAIIDAAVQAGVQRFIPSEYGIDSSDSRAGRYVPLIAKKQEVIAYLRTKESAGLSWSAVVVGSFFDWTFEHPGFLGWNVPKRQVTLFDGGNVEYEATTVPQIARTILAALKPEYFKATKNQYVFVNSWTLTQKQILEGLERLTGDKFEVSVESAEAFGKKGLDMLAKGDGMGSSNAIVAAIYGHGGLNNYSKTRELWNERLGLPAEDFEEVLKEIVMAHGK